MEVVIIGIVLLLKGVQGYFSKKLSGYLVDRLTYLSYLIYGLFVSAALAGGLALLQGESLRIDAATLGFSILCGISMAICMVTNLIALKDGAVVLVQVFSMAGILIPCILGTFLFAESVSILQFAGVAILLLSTCLLMQYSSGLYGKTTAKGILLLILVLVSNGTTMLAQKMFAFYIPDGNVSMFSFLSFGIPALALLPFQVLTAKKEKRKVQMLPGKVLLIGGILAVTLLFVSQLSTVVSATLPSVLVFPVVNGGGLILSSIIAAVFYREKLTLRSIAGLALGLAALMIINGC